MVSPWTFTIYINDLQAGTECNIAKFADDTKIGGKAGSEVDIKILQMDIDRLGEWAKIWQMEFNVDKCKKK